MQIRRIDPAQHGALGRITLRAYQDLERVPYLGPYEVELLDVSGRDHDSEVYVAIDDDQILMGGVTYVPNATRRMSEFDDPEGAGIRMLAVDPEYQGRGAGLALVDVCVARAREQQRRRVILHSTPVMVVAQGLYVKLGFIRAATLDVTLTDEPFSVSEPLLLVAYVLELSPT